MSERRRHFKIDPNMFLPDGEKLYPTEEDHRMDTTSTKEGEDMPFLTMVDHSVREVVLDILNEEMSDQEREQYMVAVMPPDAFASYRKWLSRKQRSSSIDQSMFLDLLPPGLKKIALKYIDAEKFGGLDILMKNGPPAPLEAYEKWRKQQLESASSLLIDKSVFIGMMRSDQQKLVREYVEKGHDQLDCLMNRMSSRRLISDACYEAHRMWRAQGQEKANVRTDEGNTSAQQTKSIAQKTSVESERKVFSDPSPSLDDPLSTVFLHYLKPTKRADAEKFLSAGDIRNLEKLLRTAPSADRQYQDWKARNRKNVVGDSRTGNQPTHGTNEKSSSNGTPSTELPNKPSYAEATRSSSYKSTNGNQKSVSAKPNPKMFGQSKDAIESSSRSPIVVSDQNTTLVKHPFSSSVNIETVSAQPRYTETNSNVVSDHHIVQQPISLSIGTETVSARPNHTAPHPSTYGMPPKSILNNRTNIPAELPKTRPAIDKKSDCLNILVLGETGVGKSTFINGLVNYLKYNSMDEALKGGVEVLIDSAFSLTDDKFKSHKISCESTISVEKNVGSNENTLAGQSATQDPKSYVFSCGSAGEEKKIRLIDTPGIGDTRGPDQDKINFDKILSFISKYSELHAVCILIKPNTARLTAAFKFCIDELLVHLHKSASKNILFCFTNTRGTLYKPGDTLPTLREHLKNLKAKTNVDIPINKSTVFCFDNESFRFLCALKHGFPFTDTDIDNFAASWKQSVQETEKLLARISQLPVHSVRDTMSLNNTRNLIFSLARPLGEMAKTQFINMQMMNEKVDQILRNAEAGGNLKGHLHVKQAVLMQIPLDKPQTVCTSPSCVHMQQINPESAVVTTIYKTICHAECYLEGVSRGVVPNPKLEGCYAMKPNGVCKVCGCGWDKHMHIMYRLEPQVKMVVDPDVMASIQRKDDANVTLNIFLDNEKKKNDILWVECKFLVTTCAEFTVFMHNSSMTAYFDSFEQYIQYLITEEEWKVSVGGHSGLLAHLRELMGFYRQEILTIRSSSGARNVKSIDEIEELINQLGQLQSCGSTVNAVRDMLVNAANQDPNDGHVVAVGNSNLGGAVSKLFSAI